MCGVVAVLSELPLAPREELGAAMSRLLSHRGPDGHGLLSFGAGPGVTLGHRRLAIVDLSDAGAQPMSRGALSVSYNGEFYNYLEVRAELAGRGHRFIGNSDTEVLLALCEEFGVPEALQRVNGMFALALYDGRTGALWLARDRFGEKPLYYLLTGEHCLVASEPKAILHGARALGIAMGVQREVLACYLADAEHEVGSETFFSQISRVRPGEWLRIERRPDGRLQRVAGRYYELTPERCPPIEGPAADAALHDLLGDAVRLRLRGDVEVAACLSGGLDSSTLVGLAAQSGPRLRTFSAIHAPGDPWDERAYIKAVVAHTGVENHACDPADLLQGPDGLAAFASFLDHHDEPVGGPSVWAQHAVYRLMAQRGQRVALSGQGADECLGGYGGTLPALRRHLLGRHRWRGLSAELAAISGWGRQAQGLLQALVSTLRGELAERRPATYEAWLEARWQRHFWGSRYLDLPALAIQCPPLPPELPQASAFDRRSALHGYLYRLLGGPSLATILRYEDRNSMACSVEARAPFLDPRVVEHCLSRSPQELAGQGLTKCLLRRVFAAELPAVVRERRDKVGFGAPPWRWLAGPLRPLVEDLLAGATLRRLPFLRRDRLQSDFAGVIAGREPGAGASEGFFRALNVLLWLETKGLAL
ncbi:MAG TPA: asparagine synthase (glutamine-hydrolyzing) [Pseudomonadota bacterium]|nr:asparagine synthase (glutamine-hydrolyzing) [Pseudomonadota bacterium]